MKGQGWNDFENAANKGPVSFGIKVIVAVFILAAVAGGIGYVFGWFGEGAQVAQQQFGPKAALAKYEHFKDMSAQLDAFNATITANQARAKSIEDGYTVDGKLLPRTQWSRDDREAYNQIQTEVAGIKGAYNNLAAEYNADMAKFNYRFANQGDLPPGADKPLPREYKPYVN
jgi:hypothetical protein